MIIRKPCAATGRPSGRALTRVSAVRLFLLACLCVTQHAAQAGGACEAVGDLVPICGMQGPEDIEVAPDGRHLIASQMHFVLQGDRIWGPGSLVSVDTATQAVRRLYPHGGKRSTAGPWGDASCPGEIGAQLTPHGIHLSQRADGKQQLLVVNHSVRESVEMFEVTERQGKHHGQPELTWRGCVVVPQPGNINDVVALRDGGFLVTVLSNLPAPDSMGQAAKLAAQGKDTGMVWRWHPQQGFSVLAGSWAPIPNGIQIDAAERYVYLNTAKEVRKIDIEQGKVVGRAPAPHPDNSSWARDGRLLVMAVEEIGQVMACFTARDQPCSAAFEILAIDPDTMRSEVLLRHAGPLFGGGTVAVQHGEHLYIGSFLGDRMLRVPLPK